MSEKTIHLYNAQSGAVPKGKPGTTGSGIFGPSRETVWSGPGGLSVGFVRWSGQTKFSKFPSTETLVVVNGDLHLASPGAEFRLGPGDSVVISRGTEVTITAGENTRWIFCATEAVTSHSAGVVAIDRNAALSPSAPPPVQYVKGEMPQCRNAEMFEDVEARFRTGVWGTTPHVRLSRPHPVHELMFIIDGHAEVTDADGTKHHIGAGDAIFVARGVVNELALRTPLKKIFVIAES